MPSLSELEKFKASFNDIGGEKASLRAKNIPFNDLKLPDSEPKPIVHNPDPPDASPADGFGEGEDGIDDLDFSTFTSVPVEDIPVLSPDADIPPAEASPEASPPEASPNDEFYSPAELLANLSDELEAIPEEPPPEEALAEETPAETPTLDSKPADTEPDLPPEPELDLDSLDNFDFPEDLNELEPPAKPADADGSAGSGDLDDLGDLGSPDSDFSMDDLGDLGSPNEDSGSPDSDFSMDDLGDLGSPSEDSGSPDSDFSMDDLGDLGSPSDDSGSPDSDFSMDDLGDLGIPSDDSGSPSEDSSSPDSDFSIDDLGDLGSPNEDSSSPDSDFSMDDLGDLGSPSEDSGSPDSDFSMDDLGDLGSPSDDLGSPSEDSSSPDSDFSMDDLGDLGIPSDDSGSPSEDSGSPDSDFSMDDLGDLGSPSDDLGSPSEDSGSPDSDFSMDDLGDLGSPSDDLGSPSEDSSSPDSDFSMDDLGDLGSPSDDLGSPSEDSGSPDSDFSMDDLGDLGSPSEDSPAEPADTGKSANPDNIDDLNDFDIFDESATAGSSVDFGSESNFASPDDLIPLETNERDSPDSTDTVDESDTPASTDDDFDLGDMDNMIPAAESPDSKSGAETETDHIDDFSFPELDSLLQDTPKKPTIGTAPAAKEKGKPQSKRKAAKKGRSEPLPDDVEEIHLSDDELQGLQETLSRYPLNLRIACEEIITEHVVPPQQLADLIEHLVWGASAKETAVLAGRILNRTISIPKAFQKSTGAALEAEQASFAYIFVHNFLPVLRIFTFIALVAASIFYLCYKFAYIPYKAENLYQMGYERIFAGEYQRANERFSEAFAIHRDKNWFYKYAEAFRDERQYLYAEQKYDELLSYYLRDKKGVLDYAYLETYYLRNYAKADTLLRHQLLDYAPDDYEGLLAAGDNYLAWGEVEPAKYEDARFSYARLLEKYGWKPPIVERMMKYFIRTDNLKEVLPLKQWFDYNPKWELSAETLGELGGYLLDKKLEEVRGVPNEYVEHIDGVRDLLLKAVYADPTLPEPHYHLARYYHSLGLVHEERSTLRVAVRTFEAAREESVRRLTYRIDAHRRYADVLINDREFMPAEEQLLKGINLYEDAVSRRLIARAPQYGKLYAGLGDLEYFTKTGDMEASLYYYHRAEQNGWAPPEMQYRMGAAYYHLENWKNALEYLAAASSRLPLNRRILFAMGNTALKRGDYFVAMGYYNRLLNMLENQRSRLPVLLPNDRPDYLELAERLMMARNNAGVACEMLAAQTGTRSYYSRAMAFYAEADRAWDSLTRDPRSMIRSNSIPLPYLNSRNTLHPQTDYEPQIFIGIDWEALEDSPWEELSPLLRMEAGRSN